MAETGFELCPTLFCLYLGGVGWEMAKKMGAQQGGRRFQRVISNLAGPSQGAAPPMPALHTIPVVDLPHFCISRCALLLGPSCPWLTTWALPKAQSQAVPLLRGAGIHPRSKSRLPYQTRSSLNFYRPGSIINELSVPCCRAPSWS